MNRIVRWVITLHASLLGLYPEFFRTEFGGELHGVFTDMFVEASRKNLLAGIRIILREFAELPINALDERLGRVWRSGYLMAKIKSMFRSLIAPLFRILFRAVLIETALLLVLVNIAHWKGWVDLPGFRIHPQIRTQLSDVCFYTGNIVLFVALVSFIGVRQYPMYSTWPKMNLTPFMRLQTVETEAEWGIGVHGASPGLAGFLHKYATPLALILAGAATLCLAVWLA